MSQDTTLEVPCHCDAKRAPNGQDEDGGVRSCGHRRRVLLGGCGASHPQGSSAPPSTTESSTTTAPAAPTTSTTAAEPPAGFAAAKSEWQQGATASSADQGTYLTQAATDLNGAIGSGAANTSGYATAVQELQQLASLPDADQTAAQSSEFQSDTTALNTFFGTSGLYQ